MKSLQLCFSLLAGIFLISSVSAEPLKVDFSWRKQAGEFPKDKPGYLILTTEDTVLWSQKLAAFVKQKEAMGFRVYVATEKDYGTGKTGNAQAAQVRTWLCGMQKRTGAKYALLIGNSNPESSNLPSPTIPDGERGGMEASYCDLDGKWVDLYLNTKEVDTRSGWAQACGGSILIRKAMQEGGPRADELIVSRISCVGSEIGNGIYDLDRILDKTIRYEQETTAGKNLDWRGHALSVITNYGGANWDDSFIQTVEQTGGSIEWHSDLGISGNFVPESIFDGQPSNTQLLNRSRRAGMVCMMSHGWSRGGAGTTSLPATFGEVDDRWPASIGVSACTGLALADTCNQGQIWLRKGAIFVCGTAQSVNNWCRVPLQVNQLTKRVSVGEAVNNEVVQFGDPSLHVLPPEGVPVCALRIQPALNSFYAERILEKGRTLTPLRQVYTFTNVSKNPMSLVLECDAAWVELSASKLTLKPGDSQEVTAQSNERLSRMAPGFHMANLRFLRSDGQRDERRFAVNLAPISPIAAYTFDNQIEGNRFADLSMAIPETAWLDNSSLWLVAVQKGPHWKRFVNLGEKFAGYSAVPGKVGGALRLDHTPNPFSRGLPGFAKWRGVSASLWFRVDALPAEKKTENLLAAPFSLSVDSVGQLSFSHGAQAVSCGKVAVGEWHFVQFRTDVAKEKVRASLDGQPEVLAPLKIAQSPTITVGNGACTLDEVKVWSGELSDSAQTAEFAAKDKPFAMPAPPAAPAAGYADDGVLRAPKDMPVTFDLADANSRLDLTKNLTAAQLTCTGWREAPPWLDFKNGVLSLKPGTNFDTLDFGGYDFLLQLKAADGRRCEHLMKVRVPVPAVRIRVARAADNTVSIVNAGDAFGKPDRPLAKGVIRYTTNGSPVTGSSPIYSAPFKVNSGDKVTARFFYLGRYPYAPTTFGSQFGMPREKWKVAAVSGNASSLAAAPSAFDGKPDTAWQHAGGSFPQSFAWDLGASVSLGGLSVHSTVRDPNGRIKGYTLYASENGQTWTKVTSGELESSPNPLNIKASCRARYLKFEANSLHAGNDMVLTEIEVFGQ